MVYFTVNKLSDNNLALFKKSKIESFVEVKYNMINVKYLKVLLAVYHTTLMLLLFNALYLFFLMYYFNVFFLLYTKCVRKKLFYINFSNDS